METIKIRDLKVVIVLSKQCRFSETQSSETMTIILAAVMISMRTIFMEESLTTMFFSMMRTVSMTNHL
jgi:hypothetical protein